MVEDEALVEQLRGAFEQEVALLGPSFENSKDAISYTEQFDEITPIVLLAVPEGLNWSVLRRYLRDSKATARILTRRIVAFTVRSGKPSGRAANKRTALKLRSLLSEDFFQVAINRSPPDRGRVNLVVARGFHLASQILQEWSDAIAGADARAVFAQQGTPKRAYDLFFSYSRSDKTIAEQLNKALDAHSITAWWDAKDIRVGEDFQNALSDALASGKALLALCSRRQSKSSWCYREINTFLLLDKPIFPVAIEWPATFGKMKRLLRRRHIYILDRCDFDRAARFIANWIATSRARED